jgi:hypothetical protein
MSDPQNLGLNELGQRVQAMADPAAEPRHRNQWEQYQGAPLPVGPPASRVPNSSYEAFEDVRVGPLPPTPPAAQPAAPAGQSVSTSWHTATSAPAPVSASPAAAEQHSEPSATAAHNPSSAHTGTAPRAADAPVAASAPASAATSQAGAAPEDPNSPKSGLQKIVQSIRTALPYVQKLLPLLDGNFATAMGALMVPHAPHPPTPPPPVTVDLEPLERILTEVRTGQRELRGQVAEQAAVFKRVEDQLERVREATDRNTLEQQELVEDLRSVGNRISNLALIGLVLVLILVGLNVYFLIQLQHILR